ncbi:hypothetical protein BU17DRAFT_68333 [Hysterangium stoloniferum]|nr:hypothetical protein BU17DRAFT_68333 [Hysterangium stoloniferum]
MINKKRNSSSTRSYTPENPPATLYHLQTFTSHLLEEANSSNQPSSQYRRRLQVLSVTALHLNTPDLVLASPSHADPDPDANVFLDDGMDVDTEFTPRSVIQKQESTGPLSSNDKVSLDNDSRAACDETNPPPAASAQPSPSKVHAVIIIAHIKANVEIQAATLSSSASAHTSTSNEVNARQSTRHLPNRDVKVKLFCDDSPGPSTPRTTFKPKPKSNVACPLDMLLKDNRREEARKGRVEGKRDTKADVGM